MAQDSKDNWIEDRDFVMPDDSQIAQMQREYAHKGVCECKNESRLCAYPLPVYMKEHCLAFCKSGKEMIAILGQLDQIFVSRNKKLVDFIVKSLGKNCIAVASKGELIQDIDVNIQRMPIKQSMYRLISLHSSMSIDLDGLFAYDKSVSLQEVVTRHLILGSVLHGLCI